MKKSFNFLFIILLSLIVQKIEATGYYVELSSYNKIYHKKILKNLKHTLIENNKAFIYEDIKTIQTNLDTEYIEPIVRVSSNSIIPGKNFINKNPLSNYQWHLKYSGQKLQKDDDDINSFIIKGNSNGDLDFEDKVPSNKILEKVIVAIIDSGVDIEHPELKNKIFQNTDECKNGKLPLRPKKDNDKNGYIGDCMGWDFTTRDVEKNKLGDNRVEDKWGHGTHIAGIIAANSNDQTGVIGLANNAIILPLKVLTKQNEGSQLSGFSDRIVLAIEYAINSGAKIINLSLGWPKILDQKHLRDAVYKAIDNDILVIAAAGNNSNDGPILPCSYEGVLCVGATSIDGELSNFSNFGGHVDVLAPGDEILSTNPVTEDPIFFAVKNYEIRSGTSQAAPMVSALAAKILGHQIELSAKQVREKIILGSRKRTNANNSINGLINYKNSLKSNLKSNNETKLIPILKGTNVISINGNTIKKEFKFERIGRKRKIESKEKVEIKVFQDKNEIYKKSFELSSESDREIVNLEFSINNLSTNSRIEILFKIKDQIYRQRYFISQEITLNKLISKRSVEFKIPIEKIKTLQSVKKNDQGIYFYQSVNEKNKTITLVFFQANLKKGTFNNIFSHKIQNSKRLLSAVTRDLNNDGEEDIWLRYLTEVNQKQFVTHEFLTRKGEELYPKMSKWNLDFEGLIINPFTSNIIYANSEDLGIFPIFTFVARGKTPDLSKNPDPFEADNNTGNRLYYFVPQIRDKKLELKTKVLDDYAFNDNWLNEHNSLPNWALFSKSKENEIYFTIGRDYLMQNKVGKINLSKLDIKNPSNSILSFTYNDIEISQPILGMEGQEHFNFSTNKVENIFVGKERNKLWKFYAGKNDNFKESQKVITKRGENLLFLINSWRKNNEDHFIVQSTGSLFYFTESSKDEYLLQVTSYLPGNVFKEQFYPIRKNEEMALYVDNSAITSDNIYTIETNNERLIVPIHNNLILEKGCKGKNPTTLKGTPYFVMECRNKEEIKLKFIRML